MGAQAVRLSNGDIDNALKQKDFEVLFQPIFDLGNGALARVETFIRWRHPTLGVLPPGAFISFFETQGRMSELTRYVLAEALTAYKGWRGPYAPGFSINLALSDLSDESFPSHFTRLLREHAFPAEFVTLECPMPPVEADLATTTRQLQRLAETGARLAIEVRGRANDFLKTVKPFPFAEIKTGGAAILRFARTVRGPGLSAISELLELAAEQNAAITAVGVEDQASLSALRGLGFAAAQGNHLAKVGALSQFMPSHVNDVRSLLGLDALSSDDLAALFRTGGPALAAAPAVEEEAADAESAEAEIIAEDDGEDLAQHAVDAASGAEDSDDALVRRLAARIARADGKTADGQTADGKSASGDGEDARRARAKAAAIARAKRNGKLREQIAARNALKEKAEAQAAAASAAPRDMQERISREFAARELEETPDIPQADETPAETMDFAEPADAPAPDAHADAARAADEALFEALDREAPAPISAPSQTTTKAFDARLAVHGARARFKPPIHVSTALGAEEGIGDLYAREGAPAIHEPPPPQAAAPLPEPEPEAISAEEAEDVIPEPMASAAWLEDVVETEGEPEAPADAPRARRKGFLQRTVVPYSALKVTHFWPKSIRKRMNHRAEAAAE